MHRFTFRGSIVLAAITSLAFLSQTNAQPNFNLDNVQLSASTTLPLPSPSETPFPTPVVLLSPPAVTPLPPVLATTSNPSAQATTSAATASGICATPLEFLQCRDNVGTFLAAVQVGIDLAHLVPHDNIFKVFFIRNLHCFYFCFRQRG